MATVYKVLIFVALFALSLNLVLTHSHSPVYDVSIVPEHCQKAPPVESNYTPIGVTSSLGDMLIYETGNQTSNKVLISVYDIFGFHENTKQVADILAAEGGYYIVMPDYFRGSPFDVNNWPPKEKMIQKVLETRGDWEDTVRNDTIRVIEHFKQTKNVSSFGIYGFCWGGKISTQAATDLPEIKVAALVHPSSVTTEEANGVNAPMYLLPSMNEPDMIPFYEILKRRLGENNCGHRRFDNLSHGFAGARGNFSDPENIKAVDEVISTISTFFSKYL